MAPLAAVLLLVPLVSAQNFSVTGSKFKRNCATYAPATIPEESEALVTAIIKAYMKGADVDYTVRFINDPAASPEVGELFPGSDKLEIRWSPAVWNKSYTNKDLNRVKCMLAHEAAHAHLDHPAQHRELMKRKSEALVTDAVREDAKKKTIDSSCTFVGAALQRWQGFMCRELEQTYLQEPIRKDAEWVAIRRKDELAADLKSLHIVQDVKFDDKAGDPWACWSMMFSMPEPPPSKNKDAPPDIHPTNKERAQAMAAELKAMGLPEPCL
jgi:hypothetical protein